MLNASEIPEENQYNTSKSRAKSTVLSNLRNNLFSGRAANSSSNYPLKMMGKQFCCLRICCESGSDKSGGDVQQVVADEASTASSNYARYYCAQNRLRQSPPVSLNSQENNSLLPERISASGSQINRRDQSSTNSVSIKLKDNEYGESRVRLSSFNSNISQPSTRLPASKEEAQRNVVLQQALNGTAVVNKLFNEQQKSERDNRKSERKQESKAAKTLSAILLAFIITWTPYNVIVCWEAFYKNSVPAVYFHIAYFLCYINSTINPFCYAFCNPRFRLTYKRILTGNWKRQQPSGLNKMAYLNRT
ncbi:unnamed protein product [Litomosoides sigmodontis]|uniref:G-protein coupled receptors family 1 profile domain-containing protein n=1 Tax=Litomosoides sigmodontis TaxID=42156 RepID=A0A3P6V1A8_LITSI|nr:unnamed protein product [Litomosoides sigmodontis]